MNTLIFIVIILLLVILINVNNCQNNRKESFVCLMKEKIPNRSIRYNDTVDTFNCNKSIELSKGENLENYDSYKLTIKISKFKNFTLSNFPKIDIIYNTEYNICGGMYNNEISWRLYLKLSPTSDYLLKDIRYDLYLQINNSEPIYIPHISSINNMPQRASFQFARSYDIIIYKTKNNCYLGVVETLSNSRALQQLPEYKMDLNTLYDSTITKSDNKEIISSEEFFTSENAPEPSIKTLGGTSKIILEAFNSE